MKYFVIGYLLVISGSLTLSKSLIQGITDELIYIDCNENISSSEASNCPPYNQSNDSLIFAGPKTTEEQVRGKQQRKRSSFVDDEDLSGDGGVDGDDYLITEETTLMYPFPTNPSELSTDGHSTTTDSSKHVTDAVEDTTRHIQETVVTDFWTTESIESQNEEFSEVLHHIDYMDTDNATEHADAGDVTEENIPTEQTTQKDAAGNYKPNNLIYVLLFCAHMMRKYQ